jgi:GT2 family glycosyltransferase
MRLTAIVPATDRPASLAECVTAIRHARQSPDELIVVESPGRLGAAAARNAGAARAGGDVLVFVDADVVVHHDAFQRIREAFRARADLTAVFGSYDDAPRAGGTVSRFRNLLHHHVHHSCAGRVRSFWAGLGAVRREAFLGADGFDERRFPGRPSIEDVDLGLRLAASGALIELDPAIQGTHLKRWRLREMVAVDLLRRGTPWVATLLRTRAGYSELNLSWRHRLSAAAAATAAGAAARRQPRGAAGALAALLALNASFYAVLLRRGGPSLAAGGVLLHLLHHLTSLAALPLGAIAYLREARSDDPERLGSRPAAAIDGS